MEEVGSLLLAPHITVVLDINRESASLDPVALSTVKLYRPFERETGGVGMESCVKAQPEEPDGAITLKTHPCGAAACI